MKEIIQTKKTQKDIYKKERLYKRKLDEKKNYIKKKLYRRNTIYINVG